MNILLALLLLLPFSFAWTPSAPTCVSQYSVTGVNFILGDTATYSCNSALSSYFGILNTSGTATLAQINATHFNITSSGASCGFTYYETYMPTSGNYTGTGISEGVGCGASANFNISCIDTGESKILSGAFYLYDFNTTHYQINSTNSANITCPKTSKIRYRTFSQNGIAYITLPYYNTSTFNLFKLNGALSTFSSTTNYMSISSPSGTTLYSDFKNGSLISNTTAYCRLLLYFNNPYYGNVQLIPKITYFPGIDAMPNFVNSSDNSAYIINNTIAYIYDSVTSTWYIVPAYVCSSYSVVGSTVTLQYNPTGIANTTSGSQPLQMSLGGSCTYTNASRQISCSATDGSATIKSMTLSAYGQGNTSTACTSTGAGSSMTLTCTLPNVNGTYSYIFYGTDVQGFNYALSSNVITALESAGTTGYGRAGWLALLLIFAVSALLAPTSIALSMALGVFAIFVGMGIGIIPVTGNITVAILLAVAGFAIAYKLKV